MTAADEYHFDVHLTGDADYRIYRVVVEAATWAAGRSQAFEMGRAQYLEETGCVGVQLDAVQR